MAKFSVEKVIEIRRAYERLGSKVAVASELGIHRNSVTRALAKDFSKAPEPKPRKPHRLDAEIERLLLNAQNEAQCCAKQKPTARRIGDMLRAAGLSASQRTIERRVAAVRMRLNLAKSHEALLMLGQPSGRAQCDFGKAAAWVGGRLRELSFLILSFPHSNAAFACASWAQNACCLFDGLSALFQAAGGVPRAVRFDNLTPAVKRLRGCQRELTDGFRRFQAHFGFEAEFCAPAKGNEKGHVESKVAYIRNNFFSLGLKYDSLDELNKALLAWCQEDMARPHYRRSALISELFEHDKAALLALPAKPFEFFEQLSTQTNAQGFACFDGNFYFAGAHKANLPVIVRASSSRVEILSAENLALLSSYARSYEKNKHFQPILAFAEMLALKPKSLPYALASFSAGKASFDELKALRPKERIGAIAQALATTGPEHLTLQGFCAGLDYVPDLKKYDKLCGV